MPRIPELDRHVATQALPAVQITTRANPEDFGAAVGQGLMQVGGAVQQIYAKHKQEADQVAVMAADKQLADWETQHIYAPQTGALAVHGKDALKLPDEVEPAFEKTIGEIYNGLANDDQKQAFRAIANRRQVEVARTVARHVSREYQQYDQQETSAYVANSQDAAANNYTDPARIKTELARQAAAIKGHGQRAGLAPDLIEAQVAKAATATHEAVIDRLLAAGDYQGARDYYQTVGASIEGTAKAPIEKAIHAGVLRGEAQQHTDQIMAQHDTEADALATARKLSDPELRDAVVERVGARFTQAEQAKAQHLKTIVDDAVQTITNGGTVDDIPPQDWALVPRDKRAALRALQHQGEWYQDDKKWYAFTQLPPSKIATMNLYTEVRPYTDDAHWNRALAMQHAAQAALNGDTSKLTSTLTFQKRLSNAVIAAGLFDKTTGLKGDDAARYAKIETEAAHDVEQYEQATGKKATGDEMQQIIDKLMLHRVFIDEWGSDPERQIINVPKDERADAYVPIDKIPDAAKARLKHLAQSLGLSASNNQLERAYAAALMGDDDAQILAILKE